MSPNRTVSDVVERLALRERLLEFAAAVDVADIQGNVLRGYTHAVAAYLFLTIEDVPRARALLG